MSEKMKEQLKNLCSEADKLDENQQSVLSLIAQGMALQAELTAEQTASQNSRKEDR